MDNKIFNVNGRSREQLKKTLELALTKEDGSLRTVEGWEYKKDKGLILLWHADTKYNNNAQKFPVPVDLETITNIAAAWLKTDEAKAVPMEGWDHDASHDGDNELGFRVYCEDWGHVGSNHYAIVAVKPAYCWYGK
jgi:hypothetical protein